MFLQAQSGLDPVKPTWHPHPIDTEAPPRAEEERQTGRHTDGDRKRQRGTDGSREMVTVKYEDRDTQTSRGIKR